MGGVGAADGLRPGLAEPQIAYLAGLDQPRHGADRLLDRHVRIDAVLVVQVDMVGAKALQAGIAGRGDIFRPAVDPAAAVGQADIAELAGQDHPVAAAGDRPAHQVLVAAVAIGIRRVEEAGAALDGAVDRPDRRIVVGQAVGCRHAHAAEPDGRHFEPFPAQSARLHDRLSRHSGTSCQFASTATSAARNRFMTGQRYSTFLRSFSSRSGDSALWIRMSSRTRLK